MWGGLHKRALFNRSSSVVFDAAHLGEEELQAAVSEPERGGRRPASRLVRRSKTFHQSGGGVHVSRVSLRLARAFFIEDIYHNFLNIPGIYLMLMYLVLYIVVAVAFALLYMLYIDKCGTTWTNFPQALSFSVISLSTIGFGVEGDVYFDDCVSMSFMLILQTCFGILLDALAIGVVYERFSQPASRAAMVVFSDKAVVRHRSDGKLHLMWQVTELGRSHLIDASISAYAVRHQVDLDGSRVYFQPANMRVQVPDDEAGLHPLLSLVNRASHSLSVHHDVFSPLVPDGTRYEEGDPVINEKALREYWDSCALEIIVAVEGTDRMDGNQVQARHSYLPSDILFDHTFSTCSFPRPSDGKCVIDLERFHSLRPFESPFGSASRGDMTDGDARLDSSVTRPFSPASVDIRSDCKSGGGGGGGGGGRDGSRSGSDDDGKEDDDGMGERTEL